MINLGDKMRVSKEPEVRKQEIIDVAMKVFAEKGYEATTMKDIAKEAGVVAGLCYHYFQNKHELYQTAVTQYAKECSKAFVSVFSRTEQPLEECLGCLEKLMHEQAGDYKYKNFFDQAENELFHKQLEFYMSKEIFPYVKRYLESLAERGEIQCDRPAMLAQFLWNGQMAVINDETAPVEERVAFVREMIKRLV